MFCSHFSEGERLKKGSFGRWFLADFDCFFNLNRFVSGVPMIESSRCFSYVRAQCSSFI